MKLNIFSIVYNGFPFIERHLPIFEQLKTDWRWFLIHGPANNGGSTKWCQPQEAGLSTDGTTEYLNSIVSHPNVMVIFHELWRSKDEMVDAALAQMTTSGVLFQCDCDEIWLAEQLEKIVELFESDPSLGAIKFPCRYFVGPNLICVGENCWSNKADEYMRAWRFEPGMTPLSHEPPKFDRQLGRTMEREEARSHGLVFDHHAWTTEKQVAYKQSFYGGLYGNAVAQWKELQWKARRVNEVWPKRLSEFFPWVDDKVMVKRFQTEELSGGVESRHVSSGEGGTNTEPRSIRGSSAPPAQLFCHVGDIGDVLAALPAIRALGGGELIITDGAYGQRESMKGARFEAIKPLLETQPYITAVRWEDEPQGVTHDFRGFRAKRQIHDNLATQQAAFIGTEIKLAEPWLTVPNRRVDGPDRIVFARSNRYHNPLFPWLELWQRFGAAACFVGLLSEHQAFEQAFGRIEYVATADLLMLATFIACEAELVIANQSCPFWIAAGLGVPTVQETWANDQNSIVNRANALYSRTDYETSQIMARLASISLPVSTRFTVE